MPSVAFVIGVVLTTIAALGFHLNLDQEGATFDAWPATFGDSAALADADKAPRADKVPTPETVRHGKAGRAVQPAEAEPEAAAAASPGDKGEAQSSKSGGRSASGKAAPAAPGPPWKEWWRIHRREVERAEEKVRHEARLSEAMLRQTLMTKSEILVAGMHKQRALMEKERRLAAAEDANGGRGATPHRTAKSPARPRKLTQTAAQAQAAAGGGETARQQKKKEQRAATGK